ncbi:MAG: hypothetical protein FJZ87_15545 [Chloroflexi bacterium]|nr:hypothetical protein [Chloroflexota bacterium]
MTFPSISMDNVMKILLALNQYPILSGRIRSRMRRELFTRGIVTKEVFDEEARRKAIESQEREGLHEPYVEEKADIWETRLTRVRDALTDFYFAYNLPYTEFEAIVRLVLSERGRGDSEFVWFNPELAPQDMLIEQAETIEAMPAGERGKYEARLQEIQVVLIRTMISDQLRYIKMARQWFKVEDFKDIRMRKIGGGKVGGKAAGMLLAMRILRETAPAEIRDCFRIPVSYYLGSDVFYNFMAINGLIRWNDQKYKTEEQMRADFPALCSEFAKGQLPPEIVERLEQIVAEAADTPLIVRSSSLLEDNFGTSFAGKYESIFLPNQGSHANRLHALTQAISSIYASVLNPDALLYRHQKDLADYDERIGILIQFVEGERLGRYYLPHAAGVAFSRNLYRWSPQIREEDGFLRLVWGLGTRAVDLVADDHPRLVALSHPRLHSSSDVRTIRRYSQHKVDLIDLQANLFTSVPVEDLLHPDYGPLRYIVQVEEDGYLASIRTRSTSTDHMVVTFDGLLARTPFVSVVRDALHLLETHYGSPVDTEFAARILDPDEPRPRIRITLLQCRPQSHMQEAEGVLIPHDLQPQEIIFSTHRMVPQGFVQGIRYVLFVPSEGYFALSSQAERNQLERAISRLNTALKGHPFIAVGPGRWGTSTPDLGVHISYNDIYNARALVELAGEAVGASPEPSFGTHFFQDLMEAQIYPIAVFLDDEQAAFNREFFYSTPNHLTQFIPVDNPRVLSALHLIAVEDYSPGHHLDLIMDARNSRAVAFLVREESPEEPQMTSRAAPSQLE